MTRIRTLVSVLAVLLLLDYDVDVVLTAGDWLDIEEPGDTVIDNGDELVVPLIAAVTPIGAPFQTMPEMATPAPPRPDARSPLGCWTAGGAVAEARRRVARTCRRCGGPAM